MPNWKKIVVSGSDASLNSLNVTAGVTGSFTGSLTGTATSASFASTASYVNPLNQNVEITGSASNSLRVKGSGATSATNTLYIENSGNTGSLVVRDDARVGINTTTPSTTLHVNGNTTITGSLTVYGPNSSLNLPIYPPNYYYPALTIASTTFQGYQTSGNLMTIINTGYSIEFGSSRGYMLLKSAGDHYLQSGASSLTRLFISGSGRIGIAKSSSLNATLDIIGSQVITGSLEVSAGITGSLLGTASYATQALTASNANTASYVATAQTASYVLQAVSSSFASTASYVNTLNQTVIITGSAAVGTSSLGPNENTLTLGARDAGNEGGQLGLNAPGGTYTSASMIDNYTNFFRILKGTNAGSTNLVAQWNLHTYQMQLPAYTSPTSFTATTLVGLLGFDSSGNLLTTTTSSGGGGGGVTITNNTDNYIITATGTANTLNGESNLQFNGSSLTVTGQITSSGAIISNANGAMYFRGGDDAEFWDINVANTVGIYGQQTQGVGAVKLGSGGPTLHGSGSRLGIGTTGPVATVDINGNLYVASGITGSLQGTATTASYVVTAQTASYVLNAVSSSFASTASFVTTAQTASYILNAVSSSFASTASFVNPLNQNVTITGSLLVSGSSIVTGSFTVFTGSAIEFQVLPTGVKIGNAITDVNTVTGSLNISGSISATTLSGSDDRLLFATSAGIVSASSQTLVSAYINPAGTIAGYLNNTSSWDINGDYSGSAITGTYQGQKHYNSNYFFEAVDDNIWIRLIRG